MNKFLFIIFILLLIIKIVNNQCEPAKLRRNKYFCWDTFEYCNILRENNCRNYNCKDCLSCDGEIRCLTCIENYKLDKNRKSCVEEREESEETDTSTKDNSDEQKACHPNCLDCNFSNTNGDMNCISCKDNYYYKINGTNNCFNNDILNKGFYFKNDKYYPCDESCLTCSDEKNISSNNCLSCVNENDDEESLYLLEDKNNCEYGNISGYYLNNIEKILKRCDNRCKTCNGPYKIDYDTNIENHNCIECADNYYKLPNGSYPNNCYDRERIKEIYTHSISLDEFQNQLKDNIIIFNNSSLLINGSDFIATISPSHSLEPRDQLEKGISAIDLGNCPQIIKEYYNISESENLIIVNMESKRNKTKNEFGNNNDNSFGIEKNIQIEIYDSSGKKLDLSVCKEDIKILQYIKDINGLNIQSAFNLAKQGIDVFNASDDYFNDICHENNDGRDIIIKDRRNDIYQNISFCQKGCKYNGIDYTYFAANCMCNTSFIQNNSKIKNAFEENIKDESEKFKTLKESFISNLFEFNTNVIYCYNLVFNLKKLKNNIGFFCMIGLLLLQIIFLLVFIVKGLQSIKIYMLTFGKNNVKTEIAFTQLKNKNYSIQKSINKNSIKNKVKIIHKTGENIKQKIEKPIISEIFKHIVNDQASNININNNKTILDSSRVKINPNNKIEKFNNITNNKKSNRKKPLINKKVQAYDGSNVKEKYIKQNNFNENKGMNNLETLGNINKNINIEINKLTRGDENLLDMDYEQAILYDKRTYLRIYWRVLVDNQIILGTFFTENNLELFVIKLSFLVFNFQINFFLNAFFYTDEYISDAYHNDGILDFFTSLPKSIYSFLATLVITNLLKMLSSSKTELIGVIRNKRKEDNYIYFVNKVLKKLKIKLIVYFILVILFVLFFLYYVSAFCSVYSYSQKYLVFGFLESVGLDTLATILICLLISLFRYMAIKNRIKYLYTLSNIISALF